MIQLYGRRNSINVQKVSWALCELNIEFKWHDEHGKFGTVNVENYEKLNPQLIVPSLDHNGTIINQSNSIVRYLYRKYTDVYELSKAEDIAIAEQWMEFQATDLQLNMTPIFWGLVRNPPEDRDQELIDKNIVLLNKKFEIPITVASKLIYSEIGNVFLTRLSSIIHPPIANDEKTGMLALRSSVIQGIYIGNGKINLINFFEGYPTKTVILDVNAYSKVMNKVESISELLDFFTNSPLEKIKTN